MYNSYRYFRSTSTGEWFCEKQLGVVKSVTGDSVDQLIEKGLIEEVAEPEIIDILKANGNENVYPAILRYKQLHHVSTKEANEIIYGVLNTQKPVKDTHRSSKSNSKSKKDGENDDSRAV